MSIFDANGIMSRSSSETTIDRYESATDLNQVNTIDSSKDENGRRLLDEINSKSEHAEGKNILKDHKYCFLSAAIVLIVIISIFIIIHYNHCQPTREYSSVSGICANCTKENKTEEKDKTKEDERSLQNEVTVTEYENPMSQDGDNLPSSDMTEKDKLLPQTELEEDGKQISNSFQSNSKQTPHDVTTESQSENISEYFQNSSQSDIPVNKSLRNDEGVDDSLTTVKQSSQTDISNKSVRNDNGIEANLVTVQNSSQTGNVNTSLGDISHVSMSDQNISSSHISNNSLRNESRPFTIREKALANCGPAAVPPYMKCLLICFFSVVMVVVLIIVTVLITISIVKKPCQEKPIAEAIRRGSAGEDLNIVLSIWDDNMNKINISFLGKKDTLLYQINYEDNGARNQIVVCQHGGSAFSISCGEEKTNSCVPIPEYPNKNPETFPKHFNYVIDRQCIGKKAVLRWKT